MNAQKITFVNRDGTEVPFDQRRIYVALTNAFIAAGHDASVFSHARLTVDRIHSYVVQAIWSERLRDGRVRAVDVVAHIHAVLIRAGLMDVSQALRGD